MKKIVFVIILVVLPLPVWAATMGQRLSGRILLDVERSGEAWYVFPENHNRYYLGRPADAFAVMRELGLGVSEVDFQRIAQAGMNVAGDFILARRLSGRIVLQAEKNGEAWYINPVDLKKYYLGRPHDAFRIMRELGLGITSEDLARIHKPGTYESIDYYSSYQHKAISTASGNFTVDYAAIGLDDPNLRVITDTTKLHPVSDVAKEDGYYGAQSLGKFVLDNGGFAGINGTYFCDDSSCESSHYYFFPVYNTNLKKTVNQEELKYWTTGPMMAFDVNNKFYYYKDSRDFLPPDWSYDLGIDVAEAFAQVNGVELAAAIGNKPRLIENGMNALIDWELDNGQKYVKTVRNALGYDEKDNVVYLVVVRNATVPDLADVMKALGADYALNLDGGGSSALWYNDEYMVGPGRDIPNAIIFSEIGN